MGFNSKMAVFHVRRPFYNLSPNSRLPIPEFFKPHFTFGFFPLVVSNKPVDG